MVSFAFQLVLLEEKRASGTLGIGGWVAFRSVLGLFDGRKLLVTA